MASIRARRGNTLLTLDDRSLSVVIGNEEFRPVPVEARARQIVWSRLQRISLPLGNGNIGVGGTSSEVFIQLGGATLSFGWWMTPPDGWKGLAAVFDSLATLAPRELTSRYDFARGGE